MFEKLSYKNKYYLLIGGFFLFLYVGFQFSFSDTFSLLGELKEKEAKLEWLKEKEKDLPLLKAKMLNFEKAYTSGDSSAVRNKLTSYISEFAERNNCIVTEIPLNSSFKNDKLKVQTNTFTLKGDFFSLVSLLYKLENQYRYVTKIMSAKFYTVKEMQGKRKILYLTLITQSFEQKN